MRKVVSSMAFVLGALLSILVTILFQLYQHYSNPKYDIEINTGLTNVYCAIYRNDDFKLTRICFDDRKERDVYIAVFGDKYKMLLTEDR